MRRNKRHSLPALLLFVCGHGIAAPQAQTATVVPLSNGGQAFLTAAGFLPVNDEQKTAVR